MGARRDGAETPRPRVADLIRAARPARAGAEVGDGARTPAQHAGYPAHWEADIALRDGSAVHLRPILPSDAERLQTFHEAQSERSRYFRFFAPMPSLSPRDLERFTVVDHRDRAALVVLAADDIIAVGRYDRASATEAEVAFNVSDSHQGMGIGSILLEHLVAAARENGIRTFLADVLPQNASMLGVFTDAGFDVSRTLDDGVVTVSFDIDPTARYREVMAEREHRVEARAMEKLLHPSAIALIGVSTRTDSMGGRFLRHLQDARYPGGISIVSPDALEIGGTVTVPSIRELPPGIDLAVIALSSPEACLEAVGECGRAGVRSVLIPTEGFASALSGPGTGGRGGAPALQRRLVARARRYGMRVLGPGSFGFLRTGEDPLNVSLSPRLPRPGSVAIAGQSAALSAMLLAGVDARGIGVREFVAVGNRADVSLNDTLQHWAGDDAVSVVALALESMGNPRKFTRLARRITRSAPLVVLRPPSLGNTAPPGHDVRASTLPRAALDQVLDSSGVVTTRNVEHLMDVVEAIERQGVPSGGRVGLLSNTPALGEALRGAADAAGLEVVQDDRRIPLGTDDRLVRRAFTSMAALGEVDLVIAAILDPLTGDIARSLRELARIAAGSGVRLVACVVTDHSRFSRMREEVRSDPGLPPVHSSPAGAVRAAAGMVAAIRPAAGEEPAAAQREGIDVEAARSLVRAALGEREGPVLLSEEDTDRLLRAYGLALLPSRPVAGLEDALAAAEEIGYPLALKSTDPALRHRADLGGVRLDIAGPESLRRALAAMREALHYSPAGFAIQAMAPPGVPVVVRTQEDASLGPVVSFSLAGDATDLLGDIAYAIPPLSEQEARRLIRTPRSAVKLRGTGALPPADTAALEDLLVRTALMAEDLPEIQQLDLHPVLVGQRGCTVIGARVTLAHAPNRTDCLRRQLGGSEL